ncbi:MAG TPA: thioredoxin family protein [Phycisphaerae bacterium]|nr:thioredoxin family protein [Phycisphaerae bacterium]
MKIEILGTGCAKCNMLEAAAKSAANKLGIAYEIEHIKDINEFIKRGIMMTPALVVDGQVKVSGVVPSETELTQMLSNVGPTVR